MEFFPALLIVGLVVGLLVGGEVGLFAGDCVWVLEFLLDLLKVGLFVGPTLGAAVGGFVVSSNEETTLSLITAVMVPLEFLFMLLARLPLETLVTRA